MSATAGQASLVASTATEVPLPLDVGEVAAPRVVLRVLRIVRVRAEINAPRAMLRSVSNVELDGTASNGKRINTLLVAR